MTPRTWEWAWKDARPLQRAMRAAQCIVLGRQRAATGGVASCRIIGDGQGRLCVVAGDGRRTLRTVIGTGSDATDECDVAVPIAAVVAIAGSSGPGLHLRAAKGGAVELSATGKPGDRERFEGVVAMTRATLEQALVDEGSGPTAPSLPRKAALRALRATAAATAAGELAWCRLTLSREGLSAVPATAAGQQAEGCRETPLAAGAIGVKQPARATVRRDHLIETLRTMHGSTLWLRISGRNGRPTIRIGSTRADEITVLQAEPPLENPPGAPDTPGRGERGAGAC